MNPSTKAGFLPTVKTDVPATGITVAGKTTLENIHQSNVFANIASANQLPTDNTIQLKEPIPVAQTHHELGMQPNVTATRAGESNAITAGSGSTFANSPTVVNGPRGAAGGSEQGTGDSGQNGRGASASSLEGGRRSGPTSASTNRNDAGTPHGVVPGKYLVFSLASEEFALPVTKVKEIISMQEITNVPQTPGFVLGVINLRGKVVPVIDLRIKLGTPANIDQRSCIIVMQPEKNRAFCQIGAVVDGVSEVLPVQTQDMESTASFGHGLIQAGYVAGIAKIRGKVKVLLDVDKILSQEDLLAVEGIGQIGAN